MANNAIWRAATMCMAAVVGTAAGSALSPTTTRAADCEDDYCDLFWIDECAHNNDIHHNCDETDDGCKHTLCS